MGTASFYQDLPVLGRFIDVTDSGRYAPLPDDWFIAVADVVDSTGAVRRGKYREVNILGASPIAGILNAARNNDVDPASIPFVFGGDGAVVCVPESLADPARGVMSAIQPIAEDAYDLQIRTAVVPVTYAREQGHACNVARVYLSEHFDQAVFSGGGIAFVEEALKKGDLPSRFLVAADPDSKADFTGLQCRWQEVPSSREETLAILVKAHADEERVYRRVLETVEEIFGEDPSPHPITQNHLHMSMKPSELLREVKLHTFGQNWLARLGALLKVELQTLLGKVLMRLGVQTSVTDWGAYRRDMRVNADYRKFDDMLRLVICGTAKEREALRTVLDEKRDAGVLDYGIHSADTALITCMVFRFEHAHLHFVDGGNGGYTLAAKEMRGTAGTTGKGEVG